MSGPGLMPITSDRDVTAVRGQVADVAAEVGFSLVQQTKLVTAASELARNTLIHGGGGQVLIDTVRDRDRVGIRLVFTDHGPGIPDLDRALADGYTTGGGLGLGLGGARRLVQEFTVDTAPGRGTTVTVCSWVSILVSAQ